MYYRYRTYFDNVGRFGQKDPIGYGGGDVNIYAYAENRPEYYIDSYGLAGESISQGPSSEPIPGENCPKEDLGLSAVYTYTFTTKSCNKYHWAGNSYLVSTGVTGSWGGAGTPSLSSPNGTSITMGLGKTASWEKWVWVRKFFVQPYKYKAALVQKVTCVCDEFLWHEYYYWQPQGKTYWVDYEHWKDGAGREVVWETGAYTYKVEVREPGQTLQQRQLTSGWADTQFSVKLESSPTGKPDDADMSLPQDTCPF